MRYAAFIFVVLTLAGSVRAEWFGPRDSSATVALAFGTDRQAVQAWKCPHAASADSILFSPKYHYADDTTWGVIYSDSAGIPHEQVGRTNEYHTGTGTGPTFLSFSGVNLSEDVVYHIGIEHRSGSASNSSFLTHTDSLHNKVWHYWDDTAQTTWDKGSDVIQETGQMPWFHLYETPSQAYETTLVETTFTLLNCTYLEQGTLGSCCDEHGSGGYVSVGRGVSILVMLRPVISGDSAQEDSITDWFQSAIDFMYYDSLILDWVSDNQMTSADTAALHYLKIDTIDNVGRRFYEATANWDSINDPYQWYTAGAGSNTYDYWDEYLDKIYYDDTVAGRFRLGDDSVTYGPHLQWGDSINAGDREFRGYLIKSHSGFGSANDYINFASDDATIKPTIKLGGYKISAVFTPSTATQRHDGNRHDGGRHR